MQNKFNLLRMGVVCTAITVFLPLLAGCPGAGAGQQQNSKPNKLPKLNFHKPADFSTAVIRLEEIRQGFVSDQPLPPPKVFNVVESIHGSGVGAHSHYHLAKESSAENHDHAHDHGHSHDGESSQVTHEVQVDVVTEMVDIVKWLPDIAADSDMNKESWETVQRESNRLHDTLIEKLASETGPVGQGQSLRNMDDSVVSFLETMRTIADQSEKSEPGQKEGTGN